MKLRISTLDKKDSCSGIEPRVAIRIEIFDNDQWHNTGLHNYYESEWLLLKALLILGTRRTNIEVEERDLTI